MLATGWKGIWGRDQVLPHIPDTDLIESDLANGADLELLQKTMSRIEGIVKADLERPARVLTDGRERQWLMELSMEVEEVTGKQRKLREKTTPDLCKTGAGAIEAISVDPNPFQTFVRTPKGNLTLIWVSATASVRDLKYNIANQIGYPAGKQHLYQGQIASAP